MQFNFAIFVSSSLAVSNLHGYVHPTSSRNVVIVLLVKIMIISFKPSMVIVVIALSAYYLDLSMKQIGSRQMK